jgi:hypothetical protein
VVDDQLLKSLDAKLGALVALLADIHLRNYGSVRQQRVRSLDRILTDAGMSARDIGRLLGKTERAVHLSLQAEKKPSGKAATTEPAEH